MADAICYIVGAGEDYGVDFTLREGDLLIAADGGYARVEAAGLKPDLIIGDLDSVGEQDAEKIAALYQQEPEKFVLLPQEKDETDMLAAIHEGMQRGYRDFRIYAGQGGRLEHTIANIQCLKFLKENGCTGYLCDGTGMILLAKDECVSFRKENEGYLSVFCMGDRAEGVTIRGMKYELENAELTNSFPVGISNEFIGEAAQIEVRKGTLLLILAWA